MLQHVCWEKCQGVNWALGSAADVPVKNNAKFAADMSKRLFRLNNYENFVFSPVSLEILLAMVLEGSDGNTDAQIRKHIFQCEDSDRYCVGNYIFSLSNAWRGFTSDFVHMKFAPVLAVNENFAVKDQFKQRIGLIPSAQFLQVDFAKKRNAVAYEIDEIVARKTAYRVKNSIPPGSLKASTDMVLVNALYLNASFYEPFYEIKEGQFFEPGAALFHNVEFLHGEFHDIFYHERGPFSMIGVPLSEGSISLYVAMQKNNYRINVADIIRRTLAGEIEFEQKTVDVKLPKFTMEYTIQDVIEHVKSLNVTDMFDKSTANFGHLLQNPWDKVVVSDIHHKAYFEVTKNGIDDRAAPTIDGVFHMLDPATANFHANSPFAFFITMKHGTATRKFESVLFAGQYSRPPQ
uniref:Serpin domain-containing protein n=1 Tax=Romanomermis culicivorax TaxID=13658 RepID=A0A915KIJ4_ROMCU